MREAAPNTWPSFVGVPIASRVLAPANRRRRREKARLMGLAVWCDIKEDGHASDERGAIIVTSSNSSYHHCGPHHFDALSKALAIAHEEDRCGFRFPPVGNFVITSNAKPSKSAPVQTASPS